jgi:hypothetical protein
LVKVDDGGACAPLLVEAISIVVSPRLGYSEGNLRSGSPRSDDGDVLHRPPPMGIIFGAVIGGGTGFEVERHVSFRVNDGGYWQHGSMEPRRRTHDQAHT